MIINWKYYGSFMNNILKIFWKRMFIRNFTEMQPNLSVKSFHT